MRISIYMSYPEMKAIRKATRHIPFVGKWWKAQMSKFFGYRTSCKKNGSAWWGPILTLSTELFWHRHFHKCSCGSGNTVRCSNCNKWSCLQHSHWMGGNVSFCLKCYAQYMREIETWASQWEEQVDQLVEKNIMERR